MADPAPIKISGQYERVARRCFLTVLAGGILAAPFTAEAQPAGKVPRIGALGGTPAFSPLREAFLQGLRELGYVEGRTVTIEYRYDEEKLERLPASAAELVALKVDVIVVGSTPAAIAAKQATKTIPIGFAAVIDPVADGLVATLARPGAMLRGCAPSARS